MEKPFSSQTHDLFASQVLALGGGTQIGGHMWEMCSGASAVPRKHRTANKCAWKIRDVSALETMIGWKRLGHTI